jgi:hypothetical protein
MIAVIRGVAKFIGVLPTDPPPAAPAAALSEPAARHLSYDYRKEEDREDDYRDVVIAYHRHLEGKPVLREPRLAKVSGATQASPELKEYWRACLIAGFPLRRPFAKMGTFQQDEWRREYQRQALTDVETWVTAERIVNVAILHARKNVLAAPPQLELPVEIRELIAERAAAALARRSRTTTTGGGEPPASAAPAAAPPVAVRPVSEVVGETDEPAAPTGPK